MKRRNTVCVYCASSGDVAAEYVAEARRLGSLLASKGCTMVCGAGRTGLMGALADAGLDAGGRVVGVIPQFMVDRGWCHTGLSETIVTADMHERKQTMARLADAAIALPGGVGTLEELLEIITWKQLGLFDGPIIIVNTSGYYNPLIEMLGRAAAERFMKRQHAMLWAVAADASEAIELLDSMPDITAEQKY